MKMGSIADETGKAFSQLKKGNVKAFALRLADIGCNRTYYGYHYQLFKKEIEKRFRGL